MTEPDYDSYTLDELYDAQRNVNRGEYPDRARRLDDAVRRRESEAESPQTETLQPSRTPSVITVLGILAIIFGVYGVGTHIEILVYPWTVSQQREFIQLATEAAAAKGEDTLPPVVEAALSATKHLTDPPPWHLGYSLVTGAVGVANVVAYIIGGVLLIRRRLLGFRLSVTACCLSLLLGGLRATVLYAAFGFPLVLVLPSAIIGLVFDGGLLAALLKVDTSAVTRRSNAA